MYKYSACHFSFSSLAHSYNNINKLFNYLFFLMCIVVLLHVCLWEGIRYLGAGVIYIVVSCFVANGIEPQSSEIVLLTFESSLQSLINLLYL